MEWIIANMAPLMFGALVLFLLFGYPVAFALAANGIVFGLLGIELGLLTPALFQALPERIFGIMANDTLLAIPFFTFMGLILERSGMAEDLLDTIGQLFGPLRGGLAYAVILVGVIMMTYVLFGGMIASVGSFFAGTGSTGAGSGGSVPVPDTGNFAIAHTGGLIGLDRLATRSYSASVFAGAPKYHTGGLVAGERPIIAKVGEGAFTPRQMDNADRLLGAALSRTVAANVQITVHNNAGNTEAKAQWSQGADSSVQIDIFVEEIEGRMNRRIARGEGMAPMLEQRYGLNPVAGSYR